jgi:hypothetical protein
VLELVQNADDCSYGPGVEPRLLLVLFKGSASSSNSSGVEGSHCSPHHRKRGGRMFHAHCNQAEHTTSSSSSSSSSGVAPAGDTAGAAAFTLQPCSTFNNSSSGMFVFGSQHSPPGCDITPISATSSTTNTTTTTSSSSSTSSASPAAPAGCLEPEALQGDALLAASSSSSKPAFPALPAGWCAGEALQGDALLVASNELGFSEANVRALCDMSASTKTRQAGTFTGEKGA